MEFDVEDAYHVGEYLYSRTFHCECGRDFSDSGPYNNHIRSCMARRGMVSKRLSDFQDVAPEKTKRVRFADSWLDFEDGDLDFDVTPTTSMNLATIAPSSSLTTNTLPPSSPRHGSSTPAPPSIPPSTSHSSTVPTPSAVGPSSPAPAETLGRGKRKKIPNPNYIVSQQPVPTIPISLPLYSTMDAGELSSDNVANGNIELEVDGRPNLSHEAPPNQPIVNQEDAPDTPVPGKRALKRQNGPKNRFGLYKRFYLDPNERSPHDPDTYTSTKEFRDPVPPSSLLADEDELARLLFPFPNISSFRVGQWFYGDQTLKSLGSLKQLIQIFDDDFVPSDVRTAPWSKIHKVLGGSERHTPPWFSVSRQWTKSPVTIKVPFNSRTTAPGVREYTVKDFYHRRLTDVIKEKLSRSEDAERFHFVPYELRWAPREGKDVRVHGELYTSSAFLDAYEALQRSPPEPGCNLPRYVVGLMFASDATMLATYGNVKLWPLYLFFGNESKYRRAKLSSKLGEQIPDEFKDFYIQHSGKNGPGEALLTHCHRELFHEQWRILLDDEFLEAYEHGIVIECFDGVLRRFYPRIFTYSADYPEKIILASIRNMGKCPCPRCLIKIEDVHRMGMTLDRRNRKTKQRLDTEARRSAVRKARDAIYKKNRSVKSTVVEAHLNEESLVPTENAFSERLSKFGFDLFSMLVPDVMHEVEIGVFKALFLQLLRLLEAMGPLQTNTLDLRYRLMPTFGSDTIRRFRNNVSELKQLAARDYEDILQCSVPAFDGLFSDPGHDKRTLDLLFTFAHWHSLAKMRLHTEDTLQLLDRWTTVLGEDMRTFIAKTCEVVRTQELNREYEARKRRAAKKKQKQEAVAKAAALLAGANDPSSATLETALQSAANDPAPPSAETTKNSKPSKPKKSSQPLEDAATLGVGDGRQEKTLNINTYKFHALGDVVRAIARFGTTDSFTSETLEMYHKIPKGRYKLTSKKEVTKQLSRMDTRQSQIRSIESKLDASQQTIEDEEYSEDVLNHSYFIGTSEKNPVYLHKFLLQYRKDRAIVGFLRNLRKHLYPRVLRQLLKEARSPGASLSAQNCIPILAQRLSRFEDDGSDDNDYATVVFQGERIFRHDIFTVHYTSYDLRRKQDTLNPKSCRRDFMCLKDTDSYNLDNDEHRYIYGRLLDVYHANIVYVGPGMFDYEARRFDFLWLRWYDSLENQHRWESKRLDRVSLPPVGFEASTDFLDPNGVLRGCYITPRYSQGRVFDQEHLPKGLSKLADEENDWKEYYIDRFVDCDMVMRYHWGLAVGHIECYDPELDIIPSETGSPHSEGDASESDLHGSGSSDVPDLSASLASVALDNPRQLDNLEDPDGLDLDSEDSEEEADAEDLLGHGAYT